MEYQILFTPNDMMLLDKALGALPYKEVFQLIYKINNQVKVQEEKESKKEE